MDFWKIDVFPPHTEVVLGRVYIRASPTQVMQWPRQGPAMLTSLRACFVAGVRCFASWVRHRRILLGLIVIPG